MKTCWTSLITMLLPVHDVQAKSGPGVVRVMALAGVTPL